MTEAAALTQRLAKLEKQLSSFKEITGVDPSSGPFIVTTLSINRDTVTGGYFISFLSQPGEIFQIQSSVDAVVWEVADNSVNAAASPAISSTWLSVPYAPEAIIYFRVRRYPRTLPLPDLNTPVNMSPPLADTPTLQQLLAMVASIQDQIDAIDYTADASTRLRDIHTPTQLAAALLEPGELILRLKNPITLPSGNTLIPQDKTIEFGLHWFIDGGGSTVSFHGKCVAERRTIFVGFVAGDIVGIFGRTEIYPEWWGLQTGRHDIAINCAIKSSTRAGAAGLTYPDWHGTTVSLGPRIYDVARPIDCDGGYIHIKGSGSAQTTLMTTSAWVADTWLQSDVWDDPAVNAPNHGAVIWIGGPGGGPTYRNQVTGLTISCYNASFAHRLTNKRVSGISSKGYVEENSIIDEVLITSPTGFCIGFCPHRAAGGSYPASVVNGLSITNFWMSGPTVQDMVPLYFSYSTNNVSVDVGTIDMRVGQSVSSAWASGPGTPTLPAWIVTYPLIAVKAAGFMSVSNAHIEGTVIGVHVEQNDGAGNGVNLNRLNFKWMMDKRRSAVYFDDGISGVNFANQGEADAANVVTYTNATDTPIFFGYGCGVLIALRPLLTGTTGVPWNYKDRVDIRNISTTGATLFLLRDAVYNKNIRAYGMGQDPTSGTGGIASYTRGNGYAWSTTGPTYTAIAGSPISGSYDPANPSNPVNTSRTFFTGPIY